VIRISKTICLATLLIVGVLISLNANAQTFLTNGLIAFYPFNGNANDASGNGHNGTVYGATLTTDRFGNPNSAYYFNGTSAYITAPLTNATFSGNFTASAWFNLYDISAGWPGVFDEQNEGFRLQIAGDNCGCSEPESLVSYAANALGGSQDWFMYSPKATPTHKFVQVVICKTGNSVQMYVNGQIVVTNTVQNSVTQAGQYLTIGSEFDLASGTFFHGVINDVRIYNRALSTNEVAQLFAIESQPPLILAKAVYLQDYSLSVGSNYQVQASSDLINWTNQGFAFTATSSYWQSTNYWNVPNWNQLFFRVVSSP
jgi:hypothetical protein